MPTPTLTRDEQPGEVLRFVEFWHALTGHDPEWLYFDSKLTTYAELSRLDERGVSFVTIRRRGSRLLQQLLPAARQRLDRRRDRHSQAAAETAFVIWSKPSPSTTTRGRCGRSP